MENAELGAFRPPRCTSARGWASCHDVKEFKAHQEGQSATGDPVWELAKGQPQASAWSQVGSQQVSAIAKPMFDEDFKLSAFTGPSSVPGTALSTLQV